MPILPMISATKTLNKVLFLACDLCHSSFENGRYSICNDTIDHVRVIQNEDETIEERTYQAVPFGFNVPAQSETDGSQFVITNVGLVSSNVLRAADNSIEDIIAQCWLVVANYDGGANWISLGEYLVDYNQTETIESVTANLIIKNCYGINAGKYRGKNPSVFINLNYR